MVSKYKFNNLIKSKYLRMITFIFSLCIVHFHKAYANDVNYSSSKEWNGHTYQLYNVDMTWEEAFQYCQSIGGHLVTITCEKEQDIIKNLLESVSLEYEGYWLGGIYESQWKWITEEKFSYSKFDKGEPNGSGNYLQMYQSGLWDDTTRDGTGNSGIKQHGFICEFDTLISMPKLHGMVVNGLNSDSTKCSDNDSALIYTRLCDNSLSGFKTENNIHVFQYNGSTNPITVKTMDQWITHSFSGTDENDISIFYYSGHTTWDGQSAMNYGITLGGADGYYTWKELAQTLSNKIKGKIVVILDACFAEYFATAGVNELNEDDQNRFTVLASCNMTQKSYSHIVYKKLQYSRFTYYLGKGIGFFDKKLLADSNGDGKITVKEIYSYTSKAVSKSTINYTKPMNVTCYTNNPDQVIFEYPNHKVGEIIQDSKNNCYKVIKTGKKGTVSFLKTNNKKIKGLIIPDTVIINGFTYKVTVVSSKLMKNNKKLKKVIIGKNVTKIQREAFKGCVNLKKIVIKSQSLNTVEKDSFKNIHKSANFIVPKKKTKKYKKILIRNTGFNKEMKISE